MLWWIAPSERSWNDEKDIGHQKAHFAEYAVYPAGAVCYQFWRGMADGRGCGRFGKNALVLLHAAGGAAKFLAQPAPPGLAGGPVLRRRPAAGCVPEKQERQEISTWFGIWFGPLGNP